MKKPPPPSSSNALVPAGQRMDHPENARARKLRELGAAFNRMSSANDVEALNAFERARDIIRDTGSSFYTIWKNARDNAELQKVNKKLGQQLKQALQENAKFRAMNLSYKLKGTLVQAARVFTRGFLMMTPILIVAILYLIGMLGAAGAAILLLPIGFYNASKGFLVDSPRSIAFGILILLAGIIGTSLISDRDAPVVRKHEIMLLENMNREHDLGPKTLRLTYPLSHFSRIATVLGIHDSIKVTLDEGSDPVEITCAKYYDNAVIAPERRTASEPAPPEPDIFHSVPVTTFGNCDLYARLVALQPPTTP